MNGLCSTQWDNVVETERLGASGRQKWLLLCCLASTGCTGCSCSCFWVPTNLACDIRQSVVGILRCCPRVWLGEMRRELLVSLCGDLRSFFSCLVSCPIQKPFKDLWYWFPNELTNFSLKLICLLQRFDMPALLPALNCESLNCPSSGSTSPSPLFILFTPLMDSHCTFALAVHFLWLFAYLSRFHLNKRSTCFPAELLRLLLPNYQIDLMTLIDAV